MEDKRIIYTVAEVSKMLKVNKSTVYNLIASGILKGIKCGSMKVSSYAIEDFLRDYAGFDISNPQCIQKIA